MDYIMEYANSSINQLTQPLHSDQPVLAPQKLCIYPNSQLFFLQGRVENLVSLCQVIS